jgi:hypothetical protein
MVRGERSIAMSVYFLMSYHFTTRFRGSHTWVVYQKVQTQRNTCAKRGIRVCQCRAVTNPFKVREDR